MLRGGHAPYGDGGMVTGLSGYRFRRGPGRRAWQTRDAGPTPAGGRDALGFFVAALAVYLATCPDATPYDQYARLAEAVLQGTLSLPSRPPHLEMAEYAGRAYFTNPPSPAPDGGRQRPAYLSPGLRMEQAPPASFTLCLRGFGPYGFDPWSRKEGPSGPASACCPLNPSNK